VNKHRTIHTKFLIHMLCRAGNIIPERTAGSGKKIVGISLFIGAITCMPFFISCQIGSFSEPGKVVLVPFEKLPTGEEIIEYSIKQRGGYKALAKINNRVIKGTMKVMPLGILNGTMVAYQARPNKYYSKTKVGGLTVLEQGTNGEVAWEYNPLTGYRIMDDQEKTMMMMFYDFDELNYKQHYKKTECVGAEEIEGKLCYKVILTSGDTELTKYFSKSSGLIAKQAFRFKHKLGDVKCEAVLSDYREVDGIYYAHHSVARAMNYTTNAMFTSIEHNVEIAEDQFDLPAKVRKLLEHSKEKVNLTAQI